MRIIIFLLTLLVSAQSTWCQEIASVQLEVPERIIESFVMAQDIAHNIHSSMVYVPAIMEALNVEDQQGTGQIELTTLTNAIQETVTLSTAHKDLFEPTYYQQMVAGLQEYHDELMEQYPGNRSCNNCCCIISRPPRVSNRVNSVVQLSGDVTGPSNNNTVAFVCGVPACDLGNPTLAGDVTGPSNNNTVAFVCGVAACDLVADIHPPLTLAPFGSSPNAEGATLNVPAQILNLEPASATFPGGVSIVSQTFTGDKTFNDTVTAQAGTGNALIVTGNSGATAETVTAGAGQVALAVTGNGATAETVTASSGQVGLAVTGSGAGTAVTVAAGTGIGVQITGAGTNANPALNIINGNINIPTTTSSGVGVITQASTRLIHTFGPNNFFAGSNAGNFAVTGANNVGVGPAALNLLTSGSQNIALGSSALASNTTGLQNTAIGGNSLLTNNGSQNMAIGFSALANNITGVLNISIGNNTMAANSSGSNNVVVGHAAITVGNGDDNVAVGVGALTTANGNANVGVGRTALSVTNGSNNVGVGPNALLTMTGSDNVGIGSNATITTTSNSIAIGSSATVVVSGSAIAMGNAAAIPLIGGVASSVSGGIAIGETAQSFNTNIVIGRLASAVSNTNGNTDNVVIGSGANISSSLGAASTQRNVILGSTANIAAPTGGDTSNDNIIIGYGANVTGNSSNNIAIGVGTTVAATSNQIRIGTGTTPMTSCFIDGIFGQTVNAGTGVPVLIDSTHKLGTTLSSRRYKENIKDMGDESSAIMDLEPACFNYIQDESKKQQYGLIAEQVAEKFPSLVVYKDGQPETVMYHVLPALLLNELKKQHRTINELKAQHIAQETLNRMLLERLERLEKQR